MTADGRYHPPQWCISPNEPAKTSQSLHAVRGVSAEISGGGVASASVLAEVSDKAVYTIGRGDNVDVKLKGELTSRLHAAVLQNGDGQKFLVDLRSTHGTYLGETRLIPHDPVRWLDGQNASFGFGPSAELVRLGNAEANVDGSSDPEAKRRRFTGDVGGDDDFAIVEPKIDTGGGGGLFDDLPDATVKEFVPTIEKQRFEPIKVEEDPQKILFLDIDGVLRPLHSRQDAWSNVRTIAINGARVPLMGSGEAKAAVDFWPQAMRALRHIVKKTGCRIVLSSDWRKADELKEGIALQFEEYSMPPMYGQTPDLDAATSPGVIKAIHTSFREKRCKEIRKWVKGHPKVARWIAIDDVDLSFADKEAKRSLVDEGAGIFLDPGHDFVRTNPTTGLTMELAKLAICFLNNNEVTEEILEAAYGAPAT